MFHPKYADMFICLRIMFHIPALNDSLFIARKFLTTANVFIFIKIYELTKGCIFSKNFSPQ
jgi:hypothetical protein